MNNMVNDMINVAVIGNASAGKTSFLRTLMRDSKKGKIGVPVTTNSVVSFTDDNNLICFLDTPGFEYAKDVSDWVAEVKNPYEIPSPQKIVDVIKANDTDGEMIHDKEAWESLINADVVLYLVNIRNDPTNESNLEASYDLLPVNSIIIFSHLPYVEQTLDKQLLSEYQEPWEKLKQKCGEKGIEFIEFDALHRSYEAEMEILNLIEKRTRSSKEKSINRYISNRESEEKSRLEQSFKALISLFNRLSTVKYKKNVFLISDLPNKDKNQIVDYVYNEIKEDLSQTIANLLEHFCKSILCIWGFSIIPVIDDVILKEYEVNDKFKNAFYEQYAMFKLVDINTKIIANSVEVTDNNEPKTTINSCFDEFNIKENVQWGYDYTTTFLTSLPKLTNPSLWFKNSSIYSRVSLNKNMDFINSFIPCALDFIKRVRERGIATPISNDAYRNMNDEKSNMEYTIPFIMPTEKMFDNIDQRFKEFKWKWKSQQAAEKEWIPELRELFGMPIAKK